MDDFKYFNKIMTCLQTGCIQFSHAFTSPINDLPSFVLEVSSLPLTMYAVHQLIYPNLQFQEMKHATSDDISYYYNEFFIQIPISNNDAMYTIQFIKNIIQQPHPVTFRHTIVLMFTETLKHQYANACISIINKYIKTTLFVLAQHPHGKIPFRLQHGNVCIRAAMDGKQILHNIGMEHMVGELDDVACPLQMCAMLEHLHVNDSSFIIKGLQQLSDFKSSSTEYFNNVRAFSLNILASGIPIHKFAKIALDWKPNCIQIIATFEHRMLSSHKQLFLLEHFLMNLTRSQNEQRS